TFLRVLYLVFLTTPSKLPSYPFNKPDGRELSFLCEPSKIR
ncbi:14964_t:CDS:1, partial [Cetraspora pellucida]